MDAYKPPLSDRIKKFAALLGSALAFDMLIIMLSIF
jgi:hypothetical protein